MKPQPTPNTLKPALRPDDAAGTEQGELMYVMFLVALIVLAGIGAIHSISWLMGAVQHWIQTH